MGYITCTILPHNMTDQVFAPYSRAKPGTRPGWTDQLLARRPTNVVLVAMANKTARVAWALLRYERIYEPTHAGDVPISVEIRGAGIAG